ncbi:MAG: hypothetical protein A3B27_02625 [Candidatus Taylorbacteria bacterium RIFCSPLOWO2_01_FULL_50_130]|nr:MAG: hypothetical protein A3B27_02625 [Candidatus Taylorbacteria bacterium RIFCSPLOWO2_01_FULL_50_130]
MKETGGLCHECKTGMFIEKESRRGKLIARSNYPKYKFTMSAKTTGKVSDLVARARRKALKLFPSVVRTRHVPITTLAKSQNHILGLFSILMRTTGNSFASCATISAAKSYP